ncbi:MAG: hypothetical protein LBN40_04450 [Oscillospiraceae bacterium]|jgi:hypothetical protein|nr:hypothetical protein [Oscillospiraceae bacterium]
MIDVETELFSEVSSKVRERYPNINMTGEYVKSPSDFPCVSLVEVDNATFRNTQTTESQENHVVVMYELNVYSNKTKGKKAECKEIVAFIDELLMELNFTRIMLEPVPNQDNATIYRMLGRYRAIVSKNKTIYRR